MRVLPQRRGGSYDMIIAVWEKDHEAVNGWQGEACATVQHVWQAQLLARETAIRYRTETRITMNGETVALYATDGKTLMTCAVGE